LIIEVDGGQHFESKADKKRETYLLSQGFRVLRVWNNDVLSNLERDVISLIRRGIPESGKF
jgi:very-short-patch-repair endonuclease